MLLFPSEIETRITAEQGRIWIEQSHDDGSKSIVELTVHKFMEMVNRETMIVRSALGTGDEL
jgi:hypothetical protein